MGVTDHIGELWGYKGCPVPSHASYAAHDACVQGKTRKKRKIGKIIGHCKSDQNVKRGKTT